MGIRLTRTRPMGKAGGQASGQDADRDTADAGQDALREVTAVFLVDDSQCYRDGEDHRRAHHGPENQAGQLGGLCVGSHLLGQGPATHVTGEECAGEHRRVCSEKRVDRADDRGQQLAEDGCQAHDSQHRQSQRAHGVEAFLELLAQTEFVPDDPVYGAENHANHQDPNDDLIYAHCDSRV